MTAFIRAAEARDVEAICTLLHTKMNSRFSMERWRQIMTYEWLDEKPDFGRVVEFEGRILGFVGLIYSDRMIGNEQQGFRKERFASMTSWYLDKSMRGRGLGKGLLAATKGDPDLTLTMFTNSAKPMAIVRALGYQVLDEYRFHWHRTEKATSGLDVITDAAVIHQRASDIQRQLLVDMQNMPVTPVWMESDGRQSLSFFSIKPKGEDVLWFDLLYTSDPELFTEQAESLANRLLPDSPAVLASDSRLIKRPPEDTLRQKLPVARHYLSTTVQPPEIDFLYSELQLLDQKLD